MSYSSEMYVQNELLVRLYSTNEMFWPQTFHNTFAELLKEWVYIDHIMMLMCNPVISGCRFTVIQQKLRSACYTSLHNILNAFQVYPHA